MNQVELKQVVRWFYEYLGNVNQYSELDFSLGFTYPIRISWFGLVPEIY